MTTLTEKIVGDLGDRRRWQVHGARVATLPTGSRSTVAAPEPYLTYFGATTKVDVPMDVTSVLGDEAGHGRARS